MKKIQKLLEEGRKALKLPKNHRKFNEGISDNRFNVLFDIAVCHHASQDECDCPPGIRVPDFSWLFLQDQRGNRAMSITDLDKEQTAVQNEQDKAEENENVEELDLSDQEIEDDDNDEDWEDVEEHVQKIKKGKAERFHP